MTDRILFVCDYEDTYNLEVGKHPRESEVAAVKNFRAAGHYFGMVFEKTTFLAMANMGEYEDEYDFILGSTGAGGIAMLPLDGQRRAHTRIFSDTAIQYFMCELYDLFESVGALIISADVLGLAGGDAEAERLRLAYDPAKGQGCQVQYWGGGGKYVVCHMNRDGLLMTTPFTQFCGTFKNSITAKGVADEVNRRYYGRLRAYAAGNAVNVVSVLANKAEAARRCAEFAGIAPENVWTFGNGEEDVCMLRKFNGIAMAGSAADAAGVAKYRAGSVAEAIEIIKRNCGGL